MVWQARLLFSAANAMRKTPLKHVKSTDLVHVVHCPLMFLAALGCVHTGVGNTHLNNLLSTLNVPSMNSSTLKNREREAGKVIELVAKNSCQQILNLDREKGIEYGNSLTRIIWCPLPVLTTWGGRNRGEVLTPRPDMLLSWAFELERSLTTQQKIKCAGPVMKLKRQEDNQTTTAVEKSHSGSSKSMEPLATVEHFNKVTKSNVKFSIYTGDDDATTESHLKQKVPYGVERWSDTVHIKRSLTTRQQSKFPTFQCCHRKS